MQDDDGNEEATRRTSTTLNNNNNNPPSAAAAAVLSSFEVEDDEVLEDVERMPPLSHYYSNWKPWITLASQFFILGYFCLVVLPTTFESINQMTREVEFGKVVNADWTRANILRAEYVILLKKNSFFSLETLSS